MVAAPAERGTPSGLLWLGLLAGRRASRLWSINRGWLTTSEKSWTIGNEEEKGKPLLERLSGRQNDGNAEPNGRSVVQRTTHTVKPGPLHFALLTDRV